MAAPERHAAGNHLLGGPVMLVRRRQDEGPHVRKLALIAALLLAASPVAAQQQPLGAGGQTNTSTLPNTGVICQEEIAATFCNVPTSPSHRGYGSTAVSGAASGSGGGAGSITPSIPLCSAFPPANELCN
jgi:hypothetical protein